MFGVTPLYNVQTAHVPDGDERVRMLPRQTMSQGYSF